jgi:uncharacterized protein (DUF608 family)
MKSKNMFNTKEQFPGGAPSDRGRRDFLRVTGAGAAVLAIRPLQMAFAPYASAEDVSRFLPLDKKFSPEWMSGLLLRGNPERYTKSRAEMKYIGMPVGGLCAGQLYVGGDGRLWHWDIFNQYTYTPDREGCHYSNQLTVQSPIEQRFTLKIGDRTVSLDQSGVDEVSFRGEYPIATIDYLDNSLPLTVQLEAFSPFIPLNTDDSSIPVTVLQFTLRNHSGAPVTATLCGELENGVCLFHRKETGLLRNAVHHAKGQTQLVYSAEAQAGISVDATKKLEHLSDYGTMCLTLLGAPAEETSGDTTAPFTEKLIGKLARRLTIQPDESKQVTFLIAWYFPNLSLKDSFENCGRYYATKFSSATQVADYVAAHFERLNAQTRLWRDTWYDSSLPWWFLDRTFLNTSILATSTCYRFANGRFYGWEGVGNCQGTCGHVYQYAHAIARLFPELERDVRERVDFGLAQMPDGSIHFRGEFNDFPAIDAQAGYVLRALREHQISADSRFLHRNWPKIKLAMQWLIKKDENGDGLIESNQHNTLDTDWYGEVSWLSGLYLAALEASVQMADEVGDRSFASSCRDILLAGRKNIVEQLYNGEYFLSRVDRKHLDAINSGTGCEIDQVMGQSWAFQVALPRIFPEKETRSALRALYRYNFTPDVGPYREGHKPGRWYAMPGEPGLLMCTFPQSDWSYDNAKGKGPDWAAGYFNECMNGFEYQAAGHMIWEGMLDEGFAIIRAVHERYQAKRRNPWNEIECGDHYARSMASYGVYLAACGFEYHGPGMHIGFSPRITPENFKCAFTAAEGWGRFSQTIVEGKTEAEIAVQWGSVSLRSIALKRGETAWVHVALDGASIAAHHKHVEDRLVLTFGEPVNLTAGNKLSIHTRQTG